MAIQFKNVTKTFKIPLEKRNKAQEYFLNPFKKLKTEEFHAVKNVSFEIKKGEFVGIIGKNGSGKSTILKMLAGIYKPTNGEIIINGKIAPFLELGLGFKQELSGRENVFLNGAILDMGRKYLEEKFDEIVDFAEIRDFIDLPIKNYSSGMKARLGFAIAAQAKADIYLLDEVLAVGDEAFREKSLAKAEELLLGGATVVLVTHSMQQIREYCDKIIYVDNGQILHYGNVEEGIDLYITDSKQNDQIRRTKKAMIRKEEILAKFEIEEIKIFDEKNRETNKLLPNTDFSITAQVIAKEDIKNPWIGTIISNLPNYHLYGINSGQTLPALKKGEKLKVTFTGTLNLAPGKYSIRFKARDIATHEPPVPWRLESVPLIILPQKGTRGWGTILNKGKFKYEPLDQISYQ